MVTRNERGLKKGSEFSGAFLARVIFGLVFEELVKLREAPVWLAKKKRDVSGV